MNPYQNKNEYEILDAKRNNCHMSNGYRRYPLANDPQMYLRNTHYTDWLTMCNNTNLAGWIPPGRLEFTWLNAAVATLTIISVTTALLLAPPLLVGGVIAAGAAILAGTLPLLWPADSKPEDNTFNEIMNATEVLINTKISDFVRNTANTKITSLQSLIFHYNNALDNWKKNPNDSAAINTVSTRFQIVNAFFVEAMPALSMPGYELAQLGAYAQAANLHLLLLRDGILYADKWNLAKEATYKKGDLHYQEFLNYRNQYINHCSTWFIEGQIEANNKGNGLVYQRTMTILVLDLIAMFSTYDPRLYTMPIKAEILTRTIYTDGVNRNQTRAINNPGLFRRLEQMKLHIYEYKGVQFLSGHQNIFRSMNYDHPLIHEPLQGYRSSNINNITTINLGNFDEIYSIKTESRNRIVQGSFTFDKINFYGANNKSWLFSVYNQNGPIIKHSNIPGVEAPSGTLYHRNYTHYLSNCIFQSNQNGASEPDYNTQSYIFGWHHFTIDPTGNYVTDASWVDNNSPEGKYVPQISQVPAVKASDIYNPGRVVNATVEDGPFFTGGDVIVSKAQLDGSGLARTIITFPIIPKRYIASGFRVRMYYAANHTGSLSYHAKNISVTGYASFTQTFDDGEYFRARHEHFKYIEFNTTFNLRHSGQLEEHELIINYPNTSRVSGDQLLIIDKIEFIPVGIPLNQTLEGYDDSYNQNPNASYNQNYTDTYDSGYNSSQNTDYNYDQEYNTYNQSYNNYNLGNNNYNQNSDCMCNQGYNGNYNQNSGCRCNQGDNGNYPK
ncbi:insecticidal delta-endotoxin Cry8Ea1 family protein [Bacillus wiedmannii]|uniref:insecticidal delta-endotoxin Cry8Ea1 family protein n=1 Tax=Bacillus wiedmannii TaxID=1890302 RepID=UPI0021D26AE1|nr:insecticidal delta-endotoxin Cry8Ea1 family protein [Bacillus wiedmannii]MCU5601519.1 insecticidal delta-endotoxin Cry8Ea1 family protein [Bacillus wiedmannii]